MARSPVFRALLVRLVAVYNTVAFAHDRGFLHRDLKPANIMVGLFDETLVMDWGLAKDLGGTAAEGSGTAEGDGRAPVPGTFGLLGTPAYMSPEQATEDHARIGPRSDVYALGAILYDILTGTRAIRGSSAAELILKAAGGTFPRPREVAPAMPKPLEAACLKAMRKSPSDRYDSALELARDIERWIVDDPDLAWREPRWMRLRRWVWRHRQGVAAIFVALVATSAALAFVAAREVATSQTLRDSADDLARQRDAANRSAASADHAVRFLTVGMLAAEDSKEAGTTPVRARNPITDELVHSSGREPVRDLPFTEILDRASDRIAAEFASEPLVEATIRDAIGGFYRAVGRYDRAEPQPVIARATTRSEGAATQQADRASGVAGNEWRVRRNMSKSPSRLRRP